MPIRQLLEQTTVHLTGRGSNAWGAPPAEPVTEEILTLAWSNGARHEVAVKSSPANEDPFFVLQDPVFGRVHVVEWNLNRAYLYDGTRIERHG